VETRSVRYAVNRGVTNDCRVVLFEIARDEQRELMRGNQADRLHGALRAMAVIAREPLERVSDDPRLGLAAPAFAGQHCDHDCA
jgi:hypothetical protein